MRTHGREDAADQVLIPAQSMSFDSAGSGDRTEAVSRFTNILNALMQRIRNAYGNEVRASDEGSKMWKVQLKLCHEAKPCASTAAGID